MNADEAKNWLSDRVSCETMDRLGLYHDLLLRWQRTINLVAPSSIDAMWHRHFVDSAQLYYLASNAPMSWLDFGSGAGFPGLVIAAMAKELRPDLRVTLVESDIRKAGFLREVARIMALTTVVLPNRISDIHPQSADVISARALAHLSDLVRYARPHAHDQTQFLFPKGSSYMAELESLDHDWQIATGIHSSITDPSAVVLQMRIPNCREEI